MTRSSLEAARRAVARLNPVTRMQPLTNPDDDPSVLMTTAIGFALPLVRAATPLDLRGAQNLPERGGCLVVSNHVSNYDPLVLGAFLVLNGRRPHWLAKKELFSVPLIGFVARHSDQIPVDRSHPDPRKVLGGARDQLDKGMTIVMYPEGTITADPLHWPMTPRTGAARLALETGVPVLPVGQWGPQQIMGYKKMTWPKLWPRTTMHLSCGEPVDLADLHGRQDDHDAVHEASDRIMAAIDAQVEVVRGEPAPPTRYDIRTGTRVPARRG